MAKGYIRGREADIHESHHHVMPIATYMKVFGSLMVLTVLTVLVSEADLGSASLPVAMLVAVIKSAFVIGFFMHLKYDTRFHSFVFFGTLLFIGIFFMLTFVDINTRGTLDNLHANGRYAVDHGLTVRPEPVPHEHTGHEEVNQPIPHEGEAAPAHEGEAAPAAEGEAPSH
ncbi:MAG: cytochrome C oxidase subunit IV family protein [Myxococcales bacterium]|nr:cytochrome C oxidase subunit IV family protein [Myxococcales bacterium]MCB9734132.1 cytochrome C oxidase subunit IV family protein [Deltaproteobacteria bacterium]